MRVWDPPYWRPLLHERKAALLAFLAGSNLAFRIDSSNARADYARNIIRSRVLPELEALFPGAAARLAETMLAAAVPAAGAAAGSLDEKAAWLGARLPRGTQLSRRMLQNLPGGHCLVAAAGSVPKAPRETQHRMSLKAFEAAALLEPGSNAALIRGKRQWRFMTPSVEQPPSGEQRPTTVRAFGIGTKMPLRFSCTPHASPHPVSRTWTLKELSRRWSVPEDAREEYLAIEYNQELIGLYDGESVVCPSPGDGAKRHLDHLIFETSRERPHG